MALNFPTSPTNLQQYTDNNGIVWEYLSTKGVWNKKSDVNIKEFSGAKLSLSSNLGLVSTTTQLAFDVTDFDTESYTNIVTNPSRLTISVNGFYRVSALFETGPLGAGSTYNIVIKKNGSIELANTTASPNQFISYDEVLQLVSGDYIECYVHEDDGIGTLLTTTFFEIYRVGYSIGSSFLPLDSFSGVKLTLTADESMTSTPTAISWDASDYNINADINGNVYWSVGTPGKISIYTNGYYRFKSSFVANTVGGANSYNISIKATGSTTIESASFGALENIELDETYYFQSGTYLEAYASNTGSVGKITTDSYLQLIRIGV
jgi:hypothetical protein